MVSFFHLEDPAIVLEYIRIYLAPYDLHSHRRMVFPLEWKVTGAVLFFGVLGTTLFRKSKSALFLLALFLLGLLPKIPLLAVNALMLDHWLYPSQVALGLFLAWFFSERVKNATRKKDWGLWGATALAIVWILLGWFNFAQRNTEKKLYSWADQFPSSPIVRYNLGATYYLDENYENAQPYLEKALRLKPNDVLTTSTLALTYWKLGHGSQGIALLDQWLERHPDKRPPIILLNRGVILGDEEGLKDINTLLKDNPHYLAALLAKGDILLKLNRKQESLDAFLAALAVNPRHLRALLMVGGLEADQGFFDQARQRWEKVLTLSPNNPGALNSLRWLEAREKSLQK